MNNLPQGEAIVRMFPRRKRDGKDTDTMPCRGRQPMALNLEAVQAKFNLPQQEAASALGISVTSLKQVCRKLGVTKWPYHRFVKPKVRCSQRRREEAAITEGMEQSDDNIASRILLQSTGERLHCSASFGRTAMLNEGRTAMLNGTLRQINLPQMLTQTVTTSNPICVEGQANLAKAESAALAHPLGLMQGLFKTKAQSPIFALAISKSCLSLEDVRGVHYRQNAQPLAAEGTATNHKQWPAALTTLPSFSSVLISATMHDRQINSPCLGQTLPSMPSSSCLSHVWPLLY